jgi:hypothetical protein
MSRENVEIVRRLLVWTLKGGRVTRVGGYRDRGEALEAVGLRE